MRLLSYFFPRADSINSLTTKYLTQSVHVKYLNQYSTSFFIIAQALLITSMTIITNYNKHFFDDNMIHSAVWYRFPTSSPRSIYSSNYASFLNIKLPRNAMNINMIFITVCHSGSGPRRFVLMIPTRFIFVL